MEEHGPALSDCTLTEKSYTFVRELTFLSVDSSLKKQPNK